VDARALRHYKRVLLAKRREVLATEAGAGGSALGAVAEPGDAIDRTVADSEAGIQARLRETESHLLRAIDEALKRIARGTLWGLPDVWGNHFPSAARPSALDAALPGV
jgi:RNA polymerase-binding transcription factor DksA